MAYTDRQEAVFSKLAYTDNLDERIAKYTSCGIKPPPIWDLLTPNERKELIGSYNATPEELKTWRIVEVQENPKTQFSACIIETGDNEAAVGFRGSLGANVNTIEKTWINSDIKLLVTENQTAQEADVKEFLKSHSDTLNQYKSIDFTGHSLGGDLAVYGTIMAEDCGIDTKKIRCVSLDGPGHNSEFLEKNKDKIAKVSDKITLYRWSLVGSCLGDIPGATVKYANYKAYSGDDKIGELAYYGATKHDLKSLVFNEDGSISTTNGPRPDEVAIKSLSNFLDNTVPSIMARFVPLMLFGGYGQLAYEALRFINPELASKLHDAFKKVCGAVLNKIVDFGLTVIGKAITIGGNFINGLISFFDGSLWRKMEEQKALERANESANADPNCYIDCVEYTNIASDCKKIAKKINSISNKLKKSYKLPGFFNDDRPDIPVINQLLGAINSTYNKCHEWFNKTGKAASKCDSCYDRLIAISNYLNDASTNFRQADSTIETTMNDWYNTNKEIKT